MSIERGNFYKKYFLLFLLTTSQAIRLFLQNDAFSELQKFELDDEEWKILEMYSDILGV